LTEIKDSYEIVLLRFKARWPQH